MFGIRGLIVLVIAVLGGIASFVASETLRNDAQLAWKNQATTVAETLSGTLLGWLEESYAPISGLAALTENSDTVTETEFLNAYDALESRATAFFLESAALIMPLPGTLIKNWRIKYSTDPLGILADNMRLADHPKILEAIRVAKSRHGEIILSQPIIDESNGAVVLPVALSSFTKTGNVYIVGLVNFKLLVDGLYDQSTPFGAIVRINAKFPSVDGPLAEQEIVAAKTNSPLHSAPTRTVSAGAELLINWDFDTRYAGGPSQKLANLALFSGLLGSAIITLFLAALLQRNRTITLRVEEATREVGQKESQLRMALDNMPSGIMVIDDDLTIRLFNQRYVELYELPEDLLRIGGSLRDMIQLRAERGDYGPGDPDDLVQARLGGYGGSDQQRMENKLPSGRVLETARNPTNEGFLVAICNDITDMVESQRAGKLLREALDKFSDMVILYDKDENVVFTNDRYHEIYPNAPSKDEITAYTMEKLLRRSLDAGLIDNSLAKSDPETWLQNALTSRRDKAGGSGETTHRNGRTYFFRYGWTTEGGMILVQIDITKRKQAEQEVADKQLQLNSILENINQGVVLFDHDKKIEAWNAHYPNMLHLDKEFLKRGLPLNDITFEMAKKGIYGKGDLRQLADQRVKALWSSSTSGTDLSFGDEHSYDVQSTLTPNGGLVITYTDITERKNAERIIAKAMAMVHDSIQYASRIQRSVLPAHDALSECFDDHFVIWEPKDVVGGDIYHLRSCDQGALLMVTDCTGHGVPGAFMTMIATGALDQALIEIPDGDPGRLLGRINQLVKSVLGQDSINGESDDGFECGLCLIDNTAGQIIYAAARFEIWQINGGEITTFKGDKAGIGYRRTPIDMKFKNQTIPMAPDDTFYLGTDGIVDQIGGRKFRAFGKRRLKQILSDYCPMPLADQAVRILRDFREYQHSEERRDDVTLFAFKPKTKSLN